MSLPIGTKVFLSEESVWAASDSYNPLNVEGEIISFDRCMTLPYEVRWNNEEKRTNSYKEEDLVVMDESMTAPIGVSISNPKPDQVTRIADVEFINIEPHQPGAKLDHGKNRLSLVIGGFANALWAVGEIGTFGANKYTDNGWISVENGQERYTDAMLRHFLSEMQGEVYDPDSELYHAAHTAWNALARLELMLIEEKEGAK